MQAGKKGEMGLQMVDMVGMRNISINTDANHHPTYNAPKPEATLPSARDAQISDPELDPYI